MLLPCLLSLPFLLLLSLGVLPAAVANSQVRRLIPMVNSLAVVNVLAAFTAAAASGLKLVSQVEPLSFGVAGPIRFSLYFDAVSIMMFCLVACVSWVICRFSIRYLDGEQQQGNYFRWVGFTIGAVSLFVVSGNLALMIVSLFFMSIGLHQLLVYYGDRPAARRAANIKFVFSRVGDLCLIIVSVLLYKEFGTLELPEIFAGINSASESQIANSSALLLSGWLLAFCALLKSAQFPFHIWLPETMEAPTPVSALMHAGVVNAGGYLLIRTAPIVSEVPSSMSFVAVVGAFTAVMAAVVMLSQTSVKRSLAWSTIAQMGFMMLQCGLGAFSSAMLHIIAHSLYKAHAFLSSGSVMSERYATAVVEAKPVRALASFAAFCAAAVATVGTFAVMTDTLGMSLQSKAGGYVLGCILCLGLTRWMWQMILNGMQSAARGLVITVVLLGIYLGSFTFVDSVISRTSTGTPIVSGTWLLSAVALSFGCLMLLETLMKRFGSRQLMQRFYVHSLNGFYFDAMWRRLGRASS